MSKLKVVKVYEDAKIPCKPTTNTDAGYDIYAYKFERIYIHGGGNGEKVLEMPEDIKQRLYESEADTIFLQCNERVLIDTGIKATIENGWEIQVRSRGGNAIKKGLIVGNSPGTVDSEYTGNIKVIMINTSRAHQLIKLGDAIAQIVPKKVEHLDIEIVSELPSTKRGDNGFGSSDKKGK